MTAAPHPTHRRGPALAAVLAVALAACSSPSQFRLADGGASDATLPDAVADAPGADRALDAPDAGDVVDATDAFDVTDVVAVTDIVDAPDVIDVPDVIDASDVLDVTDVTDASDRPDAVDVADAADGSGCRCGPRQACADGGACACVAGWGDCDADRSNGCETPFDTAAHCGGCGRGCQAPLNGRATCAAGACGIACDPGYVPAGGACALVAPSPTCPGAPVALAPHRELVLLGTTRGGGADTSAGCGGGSEEVVYAVTPGADGRLEVRMSSARFNSIVYARSGCSALETVACANEGTEADEVGFVTDARAGVPIQLFADGGGTGSGTFSLYLRLVPTCGNRQIDGAEGCDDGNAVAGDGCDPACRPEATAGSVCGTTPARITARPGTQVVLGTTVGAAGGPHAPATCGAPAGVPAVGQVYAVTPAAAGRLSATVRTPAGSGLDPRLFARTNCGAASDLGCSGASGSSAPESIEFEVGPGRQYPVFVEAMNGTRGAFALSLDLRVCGDGVVDPGESCDDGNGADDDGCDARCQASGACLVPEAAVNGFNAPQALPPTCASVRVDGALPLGDEDYFRLGPLVAGEIVEVEAFVGAPGACPDPNRLVVELFRADPLRVAPTYGTCQASLALECRGGPGAETCGSLTHAVPEAGEYLVRVFEHLRDQPVPSYSLRVTRRAAR